MNVALFTRAWIEIVAVLFPAEMSAVALFTRAWIEMKKKPLKFVKVVVALFTRAWIEIHTDFYHIFTHNRRPLHEGVD